MCDFIIDEMNKYDTLRIKKQVERSRALEAAGYAGIFNYSKEDMAEAKALPKSTHEARRDEIERLEEERKADLERRKQERLAKKNGKRGTDDEKIQ